MHNPAGLDSGREWIELYNNDSETYNLTGWKLNTDSSDHSLNVPPANNGTGSMLLAPGGFAVIAQDASLFLNDYPGFNGTVIDSSWSDLSNSQNRTIWIRNLTYVFDNITYPPVSEGNSSCLINNSFSSCNPTPGAANVLNLTDSTNSTVYPTSDASLDFLISSPLVNSTYTIFKINMTGKDCARLDNITLSYNITPGSAGSLSYEIVCGASLVSWAASTGNYTICGSLANISFSDTNMSNNEACKPVEVISSIRQCNTSISILSESVVNGMFEYQLSLADSYCNESSVEVEYWIEDLSGGYAKAKANTTQEFSCSRSVDRQWTPEAIGTEAYWIKAVLSTSCTDNSADNFAEKLIVVKGNPANSTCPVIRCPVNNVTGASSPKIISYSPKVYAGEAFEIIVDVSNGSVYSYVYSGSTPVSEWNGKKSWNANEVQNASGLISLYSRIENGTAPGNYTLKVRMKDKDESRVIEVAPMPQLVVENSSAFSSCEDCDILVFGPGVKFRGKNYTATSPGTYYVLLVKGSNIFSQGKITVEKPEVTNERKSEIQGVRVTGFAPKIPGRNYFLLIKILSIMKMF